MKGGGILLLFEAMCVSRSTYINTYIHAMIHRRARARARQGCAHKLASLSSHVNAIYSFPPHHIKNYIRENECVLVRCIQEDFYPNSHTYRALLVLSFPPNLLSAAPICSQPPQFALSRDRKISRHTMYVLLHSSCCHRNSA